MHPFKAVYAYTPSKLPSLAAAHLKPKPAEETDAEQDTVTKPLSNVSQSGSEERSVVKGDVDHGGSATSASVVGDAEGNGAVEYSRDAGGMNGTASLREDGACGLRSVSYTHLTLPTNREV